MRSKQQWKGASMGRAARFGSSGDRDSLSVRIVEIGAARAGRASHHRSSGISRKLRGIEQMHSGPRVDAGKIQAEAAGGDRRRSEPCGARATTGRGPALQRRDCATRGKRGPPPRAARDQRGIEGSRSEAIGRSSLDACAADHPQASVAAAKSSQSRCVPAPFRATETSRTHWAAERVRLEHLCERHFTS